jgi:hypothetical protein
MIKKVPVLGGIVEEVAEELKDTGKAIIKEVGRVPGDVVQSGVSQAVDIQQPEKEVEDSRARDSKEITNHLYAKSSQAPAEVEPREILEEKAEQKKKAVREQLKNEAHARYYQTLVNRPKAPEEKPAERVERQKMEDLKEKDEKEKKKKPIVVQRAQQSVEKYRGAAG